MQSKITSKKNIFTGKKETLFTLNFTVKEESIQLKNFAWKLLHEVLPWEVRNEEIITNFKGMSHNNILSQDLSAFHNESENLIFIAEGTAPVSSENNEEQEGNNRLTEESSYFITTDFIGFLQRKNIQYKPQTKQNGELYKIFVKPVFEDFADIFVDRFFMGLEFFEPNFFSFIGFAPKITRSLLVHVEKSEINIRMKAEQKQSDTNLFQAFGDTAKHLQAVIMEIFSIDIQRT